MKDAFLEMFIEAMGEPANQRPVPAESIAQYRGRLPDKLLEYWQEQGWGSYADGLFWLVNPHDYQHLLDMWLQGTEFEKLDTYHVIGRTAFGDLYAWGETYGRKLIVLCAYNRVYAMSSEKNVPCSNPDLELQSFLSMVEREDFDMEDADGEFLFERALQALGPLGEQELYGFEPALVMGGKAVLGNLRKLQLDVHLTILRQFGR
ncbi:GAD-like domain-containing protein [Pseudomonas qingdaonensis]|uniref:GAD-like domain-containing protein n=1 Tax=Pseudomonas qingdaonensis TaxID=2056231 RepID=UPI002E170490|nr:GAD-like domain-containing protein [Pseudomonas qingdaonensis]